MAIDWGFIDNVPATDESMQMPAEYLTQVPLSAEWLESVGYPGEKYPAVQEDVQRWMAQNGLRLGNSGESQMNALIDSSGNVIGQPYSVKDTGNFMRDAALLMAGGYFGGNALAGAYGGGATAGGLTGLDAAALDAGAGAVGTTGGMTAAEAAAATGGTAGTVASAAPAAVAPAAAPAATSSLIPGITNGTLLNTGVMVGSAALQSDANRKAVNAMTDSARQANLLQKSQYDQTRADNAPWRAAGEAALAKLTGLLNDGSLSSRFAGKLDNEAGYNFAKQQGIDAIESSAAARGGFSTGSMKNVARFAENNANQFYNDAFDRWNTENTGAYNRLSNMAGLGQTANTQVGNAGQNYANQSGNNMLAMGNAQGAGAMNQGNIYGNLLNQGLGYFNNASAPNSGGRWRQMPNGDWVQQREP